MKQNCMILGTSHKQKLNTRSDTEAEPVVTADALVHLTQTELLAGNARKGISATLSPKQKRMSICQTKMRKRAPHK